MVEKAAGVFLVREFDGTALWLLLRRRSGSWGASQGRLEEGESSTDAALRELLEETGISDVWLDPGFRWTTVHSLRKKDDREAKVVDLFLGVTAESEVQLRPREHSDFVWSRLPGALPLVASSSRRAGFACAAQRLLTLRGFVEGTTAVQQAAGMTSAVGAALKAISRRALVADVQPEPGLRQRRVRDISVRRALHTVKKWWRG